MVKMRYGYEVNLLINYEVQKRREGSITLFAFFRSILHRDDVTVTSCHNHKIFGDNGFLLLTRLFFQLASSSMDGVDDGESEGGPQTSADFLR